MKRYFNMVEVMLAIVVISVGLASVFVLFPAGLSAHKTAAADNCIADLAELIISSVRTQINESTVNPDDAGKPFGDWANYTDNTAHAEVVVSDSDSDTSWKPLDLLKTGNDDHDKKANSSLLQHSSGNVFWVRQMSGPADNRFVDFSAIGRVYVDKNSMEKEFFFDGNDYKWYKKEGKVDLDNVLLPLVLELSFPAEVPYAEREKRYFRFEILNENYVLPPVTP